MIFSHIPRPLGMRKTRIGKRIYVQVVPLDTSRFCPYCCATVDTACVTSTGQISVATPKELIGRVRCYWHEIPACSLDNLPRIIKIVERDESA